MPCGIHPRAIFPEELLHLIHDVFGDHHIFLIITTSRRANDLKMPHHVWNARLSVQETQHYSDIVMSAMASLITSLMIVYSTAYSDADQRKHQSSVSLAFLRGIHRWPVNSPHKWPLTRKMFPFDDVIMRPDTYTESYCHIQLTVICVTLSMFRTECIKVSNMVASFPHGIAYRNFLRQLCNINRHFGKKNECGRRYLDFLDECCRKVIHWPCIPFYGMF